MWHEVAREIIFRGVLRGTGQIIMLWALFGGVLCVVTNRQLLFNSLTGWTLGLSAKKMHSQRSDYKYLVTIVFAMKARRCQNRRALIFD